MPMKNTVYLIDGSGYIFRAFFGITNLTTKAGFPTNALFGFTRMLKKLLLEANPEHIAVAFDVGRDTFRLAMYPEYKANRAACPEDLLKQMPFFREIVAAMGIQVLEHKGYEADDLIGTLAKRFSSFVDEVVIVSGDKDLTQLVDDKVMVYDPMHDRRFHAPEVVEKFGVRPDQVVELLALTGDASDNVPGVEGVGPKTAAQLIEKYGDVENVLRSVNSLKEDSSIRNRKKIAEQIESGAELLRLSRKLVEIKIDSPVNLKIGDSVVEAASLDNENLLGALKRGSPDWTALNDLIKRFEFTSLFDEFELSSAKPALPVAQIEPPAGAKYTTILQDNFLPWLEQFKAQSAFAFDLETTSIDTQQANIVGLSFCWSDSQAYYIPVGHKQGEGQVNLADFIKATAAVFANPEIKKAGQNLKYDIKVLARYGVAVDGVDFDSMVAAYLISPDKGSYNLTVLAHDYLGLDVIEFEQVVGESQDFSEADINDASRYACQDAHYVWLLKGKLQKRLEDEGLTKLAAEVEMPLVPVLARMELEGIKLDLPLLAGMSQEFAEQLKKIEKEIFELAGCEFNINSPKQLAEVLYERLAIPTKGLKRTKSGVSTDSSVLEILSENHPLPAKILAYRSLAKLKGTYIDALPAQVSPYTGRLHTRLNQTVTGTGRLSSSDPNLQNIPIQSEEGRKIRSAFVAQEGKVLISADYSQIELRLLAHMSNDKNMIAAFNGAVDIHSRTARELLHIDAEQKLSVEERRLGKTMNFGIVYGMGGFRLSRELGIPLGAANNYIERYFSLYSGIKVFFAQQEKEALEKGAVHTIFGRKRVLADIESNGRDKGFVLRAALNAPIQGSAADIVKYAMVRLDKCIRRERLPMRMLLQIHDELVFECDESYREDAIKLIRAEMEGVLPLSVPLLVEVGWGHNWQQAH